MLLEPEPLIRSFSAAVACFSLLAVTAANPNAMEPTPGPGAAAPQAEAQMTDRIIVKYRDPQLETAEAALDRASTLSESVGVTLQHERLMSGNAQVLQLEEPMDIDEVEELANRIAEDPNVLYAEPDAIMQIQQVPPNDPRYNEQWHYHEAAGGINLPPAWPMAVGTGTIVAVIDTGIRNHGDIASHVLPGYDFISDVQVANDGDGRDADASDPGDWCPPSSPFSSWHGLHVAGTIASLTNNNLGVAGVAHGARILPVRVLGTCGGFLSDIADGMRWAAGLAVPGVPNNPNPAHVLNLSLGGGGACGSTYSDAINDIRQRGVTIVVAAGNSNQDVSNFRPANCGGVISVAGVNRVGGRAIFRLDASGNPIRGSNFGALVDVAAPGGETHQRREDGVLSTLDTGSTTPSGDTYEFYQGTSMAAPHAAAAAALLYEVDPSITPDEVETTLRQTARAFPSASVEPCNTTICGAGIIDAEAAVGAVSSPAVALWVPNYGYTAGGWRVEEHPRMLADVDDDGRADVVGFGNAGAYVSLSTGSSFSSPALWVGNYGHDAGGWRVGQHPRLLGDVNADGKADVVGFGNAGTYVSLSTGSSFSPPALWVGNYGHDAGGWRVGQHPRMLADVDGDGKADVVGFGNAGTYVSLSTGSSFSPPALWVDNYGHDAGGWRVGQHPRLLGDVNDDGKADIVGFGNAGAYVSLSTGSSFSPPALWVGNYGHDAGGWRVAQHPRMLADVDGDGKADVVGFGNAGAYVSLSSGSSFSPPALWVDNYGHDAGGWRVEEHPRMLADMDGDGKADVVGFGNAGAYVSLSTGSSFNAPSLLVGNYGYVAGGWRVEEHPRELADADGDAKTDIIGFGYAGAYVSLLR